MEVLNVALVSVEHNERELLSSIVGGEEDVSPLDAMCIGEARPASSKTHAFPSSYTCRR
jgi:hypothetical protein